ncbi:hypothetical protein M9Y10_004548 [Tritrichomonas musculus]|uniref:Uncharacterized protein n=1 Tax=Tritrichomonas musculus TaxID=1915356 RepID=A0ABR2GNE3_9EUKA
MESNFQKDCKTGFCGIHKDYFRFVLIFIFGFLFLCFSENKVSAYISLDVSSNSSDHIKFYKDRNCTDELKTGSRLDFETASRCYLVMYAKVNLEKVYVENDGSLDMRYLGDIPNTNPVIFQFDYAKKIENGLYEIGFSAINPEFSDYNDPSDVQHYVRISVENLKEWVQPTLKDFNSSKLQYIQFYKEQDCENKIEDSFEISSTSSIYAKVDFSSAYILGNSGNLNINLIFSELGYNFTATAEKVSGLDSVYKITFKEKNNNFITRGGNLTIANINLNKRTDYNINFNLSDSMNIYESNIDGENLGQINLNSNYYTDNIQMKAGQTSYFLITPTNDKYIDEKSIEFSYIASGFNVSYTKLNSQNGGTFLVTVSDDLEYGESNRQNSISSIFVKASFLERKSFSITFPSVHGIEFYDDSNRRLSGKKPIEEFSGEYIIIAKLNSNIFQGNDLESAKKIEFSLGDNFDMISEYDENINGFRISLKSYSGKDNESYVLSLTVNSGNTKKPFVKLTVPSSKYPNTVGFYYLESNGVLSANNYKIEDEILVLPGINFNLYVRVDSLDEYDISTLSLRVTSGNIANIISGQGSDLGVSYDYSKYVIESLLNDSNVSVDLDQKKYKISLLKKIAGLEQIEYEVVYLDQDSSINHGSTSGRDYASLRKGEKITFIFKFSDKGYGQLMLKDLKLKAYPTKEDGSADKNQSPKELNVGKKVVGENGEIEINNEGIINFSEKYYSEQYEVQGIPIVFEIDGIKKDRHRIEIITDDEFEKTNYDITKLVNILPGSSDVTVEETDKVEGQNDDRRKYVIKEQEYGSYLDFLIEFKDTDHGTGYNQSIPQVLAALTENSEDINISQKSNGYWRLKIVGDSTLTVTKIKRNNYKVTVPTIGGITFKYKKVSDGYNSTNSLDGYENVPRNNQIQIEYEDNLAIAADFDYSVGWDMPKMEIKYDGTDVNIEEIKDSGGENFREYLVPNINSNLTLDVSVPLRSYDISFNKIDTNMAKAYDNSGNVLNIKDAPSIRVVHGSEYKFKIEVDYKYSKSQPNMEVYLLSKEDLDKLDSSEGNDPNSPEDNEDIYNRGSILTPGDDGMYTLPSVSFSGGVVARGLELNRYNLTFQNTDLITFTEFVKVDNTEVEQNIGGAKDFEKKSVVKEVLIGDTFKFNYKLAEGYSLEGAEITNNGEAMRKSDGVYVIYDISEDMNIMANDLSKAKYRLTFVSEAGVTFTDNYGKSISSTTAEYNSDYSFRVMVDSKYSNSEDDLIVYPEPGGEENYLKKDVSGAYTIRGITQPLEIKVKGIRINEYKVSLPINAEGAVFQIENVRSDEEKEEFEKLTNVNHGENFKFSVLAAPGYDISNVQISINSSTNKATVDVVNDGYMIQNVSEDLELSISGVKRASHTITLVGDNIIFKSDASSSAEIKGGSIDYETGEFNFVFLPLEGFEMVEDYETSWKNIIDISPSGFYTPDDTKPSDDVSPKPVFLKRNEGSNESYTLSEVTSDITITINNAVKKKTFKVVFPQVEGIKYIKFEDGNSEGQEDFNHELPLENIVYYNSTFRFEVQAEYGYDISSMQIRYDVNNYLSPVNGMYFINNIRSNINLEVLYVNKNNYNIKLKGENITFYDEDDKNPITNASIKYESGTFKFRLKPNIGYNLNLEDVIFEVDGVKYNHNQDDLDQISPKIQGPDDSGIFTVSNVEKSVTLVAKGATKQEYKIHFPIDTEGIKFIMDQTIEEFKIEVNDGVVTAVKSSTDNLLENYKLTNDEDREINGYKLIDKNGSEIKAFKIEVKDSKIIAVVDTSNNPLENYKLTNSSGVEIKNFKLVLENIAVEEIETVKYLSELKFYVVPRKGHHTSNLKVSVDPVNSADINYIDGGYTLSMIQGDFYVNVSDVGKNNYKVSFEGDGAEFYNSSNIKINNVSLQYGSSYEFKIQSTTGYDVGSGYMLHMYNPLNPDDRVTINNRYTTRSEDVTSGNLNDGEDESGNPIAGTTLSESGRLTYQITNLQDNIVIHIEDVAKNKYNVLFPSVQGIEFVSNDSTEIIHGGTFSFKIKELEGYTIKNIKVWANSDVIELINGQYTINNIINDIVISVEGVQSIKVDFKFQYIKGVIYKDTNDGILSTLDILKVNNGSSYSFKVDLSSDYSDSLSEMNVYANREKNVVVDGKETISLVKEKIDDIRGVYTVNNITESTTITVENVKINSYTVKLTDTTGIEYLDRYGDKKLGKEESVNHGEAFSFMINPIKGFIGSDVIVTAKGQNTDKVQLTAIDGVYTVENVQSDYTIVVENVSKAIYKVEVRLLDGVNLLDDSGNKLSTSLTVKHGDDLSFRLSLDEAYSNSVPEVVVKGSNNKITPVNNIYTIKSIENDTIVEISNVRKNTYVIKFKETEGVIYKNAKNKVFTDSLEVEYGGSLQFKVALKDAYDASYPLVLLNDKDAITQSGGTYELFNVRDNGEITVKNVVKNNESSVIEMVEEIDEQINSADNTTAVIEASKKYNALTDDEKELLTNVSKLKNAQEQVAKIHHTSNGVTVTGIDWNIKVEAIPMDYDQETVDRLSEKMERKSVVSLYEIKLINTLTGEKYEIPYGSEVSVSIPAPNLEGYQNEVVVHENSVGSIEYLDVLINEGTANFTTKSFSIFGIAAKEVPNYSKNSSDVTISVEGLLKDSDVGLEDLMYNGLDSQLGDLTGGSGFGSGSGGVSGSNGSSSGNNSSSSGSGISGNGNSGSGNNGSNGPSGGNAASSGLNTGIAAVDNTYLWIINNEFIIVISLVGIIVIGVSIFLIRTRNKENS